MEEKKHIGSLFDRIAGSYDRLNHLLSLDIDRLWRRRAVRRLTPVNRLLDVAVGTGDLAIEIVRQGKAQQVQGIDLSREMMAVAARKTAQRGYADRVILSQGSALELPYEDASFDAVTCGFGVRNFADLDKGLQQMYRVLRKGGETVILEFSYPSNPLIRYVYDFYFSRVLPFIGKAVSKDKTAYNYLRNSVKGFIWGETFCERLRKVGFREVTFTPLTFGICTIYQAVK